MISLGLVLFELLFLLDFCFKYLDLSTIQLAHFAVCLTTLFVIITFLNRYYLHVFCHLNNNFACFIIMAILFDNVF